MRQTNEQIAMQVMLNTSPSDLSHTTVQQWARRLVLRACELAREDEQKAVPRHVRNMFKKKKSNG